MPEEYVYKIVVDDAEIQSTLNRVDQRIKTMATKADQSFVNIGASMSSGLQQTVQQAQQASREIAQTEQRTGQQLQQTYGQVGQAATQAYGQRRQQAVTAAQAEVRAAQQVVSETKRVQQVRKDELQGAKNATSQARASAAAKTAAAKSATAAVTAQAATEKSARQEIKDAEKSGNAEAIAAANQRHSLVKQRLEDVQTVKTQAVAAAEEEKGKIAGFVAAEQARGAAATNASATVKAATDQEKSARKALTVETRAAGKEQTALARRQKQGAKAFVRTTKTYNQQRNQLHALAKRYGSFNVALGKTSGELNKQEKEVMDIIRSDKQLEAEIEKLIAKYGKLDVAIDRTTFRGGKPGGIGGTGLQGQQFRQAGFAAQRFGVPGAAVLGEAAMVGGGAGIAIAGVLLSVKALTTAFIGMGKAAVGAFASITRAGMDAAKEMEVASAQFTAFFQGDTQASEAAMKRLLDLSQELGENVVGVGRAFLPEVENLDQLEEVVKAATALARFQPEQGIMGARIALQEALSGEFRSLQRRFEISPVAIDKIREAYEESGVTGFLTELQAELERTGRSVDDLSDTWGVAMGKVRERLRQVTAELGKPIIEEYKEQLKGVDEELNRLEPDLKLIAGAFGEVLAKIVDIIGTELQNFLENFDPQPLLEVAENAFRVVSAIETIIRVAIPGRAAAGGLSTAASGLAGVLLDLEGWLLDAAWNLNEFRADFKETALAVARSLQVMARAIEFTARISPSGSGIVQGTLDLMADQIDNLVWSLEKMEDLDPLVWAEEMAAHEQRVVDYLQGVVDLEAALAASGAAGEAAASGFMTYSQAMDSARVAAQEFADAQAKINEALGEFQIAADIKFEKLLTNIARQSLDDEIEAQRKLIDIETKNIRKLAEIRGKNEDAIVDAGQELGDREADIARKNGRDRLDLEDDLAEKRLEIEQDYQDDLERLRDKFNFDAFEAILANDAKRLRQIRRRQAFEEGQAKKERDTGQKDLEAEGDDRRKELAKQLERELEDARIVNARKIRDLAISLQRQLDKQEEARRQDIANAEQAEQRKQNDLERSLERQLDDYRKWWEERNRVTQEKVAEDIENAAKWADAWAVAMAKVNALSAAQGLQTQLQAGGAFVPPPGGYQAAAPGASNIAVATSGYGQIPPTLEDVAGLEVLRGRVFELNEAILTSSGIALVGQDLERERQRIEDLSIAELVQELERVQEVIQTMAVPPEMLEGMVPTEGLVENLLRQTAAEYGKLLGLEAASIYKEVADMTAEDIQTFINDLVANAAAIMAETRALAEPAVEAEEEIEPTFVPPGTGVDAGAPAEEAAGPEIVSTADLLAGMDRDEVPVTGTLTQEAPGEPLVGSAFQQAEDEPTPVTIVTPTGQPVLPGLSVTPSIMPEPAEEEPAPTTVPEIVSTTALLTGMDRDVLPVTIVTPTGEPALPSGILATAAAGSGMGAGPVDLEGIGPIPVIPVTPAGQAISTIQAQEQEPLPTVGGLIQVTDPSVGYTAEGIMDAIQAEVEAVAAAELEKLGEIEDTTAHAALLAEAKTIAATSALDDEVGAYGRASDEEIAILESTLARHQAALAAIGDDPLLVADAAVLETSIGVLNETLERLRAEQLAAAEAALSDEVAAVEDAEKEKVDMVDETSALIGLAYLDRETAIAAGLLKEVADTETATEAETALVQAALSSQGEATTEHRATELAAIEENEEEKTSLFSGSYADHISDLHSFWIRWLAENNRAMQADLTQMFQWLQERQRMFEQAATTIPSGGITPGSGDDDDDDDDDGSGSTSGQPTMQQLQNLAVDNATTLGILTDQYLDLIMSLPYDDLVQLVHELQQQVSVGDYALGGGVTPGYAWVGERGPELVRFNQAARIDPAALFRNQPPAGIGGNITTIDQSMRNSFDFPDPRGLPPTYIATMENIAAKAIKKSYRGR